MKKIISFRLAINGCLVIFALITLYHALILTSIIPYSMTWGGRLETVEEMYRFETVSILLNLLFLVIIWLKLKNPGNKVLTILLWLMAGLFALNTLGNLFSLNNLEAYIFTPVTLILSFLFIRLAIE